MKLRHIALLAFALTAAQTAALANPFYFFQGTSSPPSGADPLPPLLNVNGVFYGTTNIGGKYNNGTIFSVSGQTVATLYSFQGPPNDGAGPEGALVMIGNVLYGTTQQGGANTKGAVFSFPVGGSNDHIIYSFGSISNDGFYPTGALALIGTNLYGTTILGGTGVHCPNTSSFDSCGTVFRVSICNCASYSTLYSFKGPDVNDGGTPYGGVAYWHDPVGNIDWLYGTTSHGGQGSPACLTPGRCGTVFRVSSSGNESVLHHFADGTDGSNPYNTGGLTIVGHSLYGTTYYGGLGEGTVFTQGVNGNNYHILYAFNGNNGEYPTGSPLEYFDIAHNTDWLYGTTTSGGTNNQNCTYPSGCGVVYKMHVDGTNEATLVTFMGHPSDGGHPYSGLTYWRDPNNGNEWLYATTQEGGPLPTLPGICQNALGCGSVFRLHP